MKNYGKLATGLIVAWFIFALSASALYLFKNDSHRIGVGVGIAALVPIVLFSLWFAVSQRFRQFTLSVNPTILTAAQAWRIIGFTFVLPGGSRRPSGVFALPAGYGDMAIGVTAAFVAWMLANPSHRNSFVLWQVLGIMDLVLAVTFSRARRLHSVPAAALWPVSTSR
jgi:hypothetical protein